MRLPLCLSLLLILLVAATACEHPDTGVPGTEPGKPAEAVHATGSMPDWCVGHGLPESMCTKCNPQLTAKFKAAGDWCAAHGFPESACPSCHPQEPPPGVEQAALENLVVRFNSPDIERHAGIETAPAQREVASAVVECTARIAFNADRMADVRAIVPGVVRRVHAELGERVERGTPLFELESTRIGEIQGALQTARESVRAAEANLDRLLGLRERDIASARQVEIAEQELARAQADVSTAEAALRMAGAEQSGPAGRYTITAPLTGTIVRRPAVVGLLAIDTESLATIADTSVMWAICEVPESEAGRVALGQPASVTVQDGHERTLDGELTWIASEVDPRTRTVAARAEVSNPHGQLRANQFARVRIETGSAPNAVFVPRSSIQRVGDEDVVFVRMNEGVYVPRVVRQNGGGEFVQVEGRVRPGDPVVTTGAVLLRTEVMPGSIGAGCCEVEPRGSS